MSVVIIGGNERMVAQYETICRAHGCKAKVFAKENGSLKKKIGCPDLLILFISTVSHKMVISVTQEAKKNRIPIAHVHTSSATALKTVLSEHCARCGKCAMAQ
ncbi:MAG: DUF2325 domain-containing protein [Eubacteriales bacterium]|nr:DUF2325 domain-containing protein [Eubacteriales bacterium]